MDRALNNPGLAAFVVGIFATALGAQPLTIGSPAPPLDVAAWIQGEAVQVGTAEPARVLILEFTAATCRPCRAAVPRLNELEGRLRDRGVRVVGIECPQERMVSPRGAAADGPRFALGADRDGATQRAYMEAARERGLPCRFVIDNASTPPRIAWIAPTPELLEPIVERLLDGSFDIEFARRYRDAWPAISRAHRLGDAPALAGLADELLALQGDAGLAWGTKYAAFADLAQDPERAREVAAAALRAMAERPHEAALFCELYLLPRDATAAIGAAAAALEPLAEQGGFAVRLAQLRALDARAEVERAAAVAKELVEATSEPFALGRLASTLDGSRHATALITATLAAVDRALADRAGSPALLYTKLRALVRSGDEAAAQATGHQLIAAIGPDLPALGELEQSLLADGALRHRIPEFERAVYEAMRKADPAAMLAQFDALVRIRSEEAHAAGLAAIEALRGDAIALNGFAWRLLDAPETRGRFPDLALLAADAILEATPRPFPYMLDTLALAKFENGQVDAAIELQRKALAEVVPHKRALFQERLARFERARRERDGKGR